MRSAFSASLHRHRRRPYLNLARRGENLNGLLCGLKSGFQELLGIFTGSPCSKMALPVYQDLSACAYNVRYHAMMHAAVHFNGKLQAASLADL